METISNTLFFQEVVSALAAGNSVRFRLVGQSMLPFLHEETDILTIKPKKSAEIRVGDIVLASYQSDYVLHRIVSIRKDGTYLLRGDAHFKKCEQVAYWNMVGVLTSIERGESIIVCHKSVAWRMKGLIWIKSAFIRMIVLRLKRAMGCVSKEK